MIRSVSIQNFRALRDVSVELRPLTVLVGVNDSGKSSFLDAVAVGGGPGESRDDRWRSGPDKPAIVLRDESNVPIEPQRERFRLPSTGACLKSDDLTEADKVAPPLAEDGRNLARVLDYLYRTDRDRFNSIEGRLRQLLPGLERLDITTPAPTRRTISFRIEGDLRVEGHHISTGARMLLFFVTLAHHPNPPDVVLVEGPENGVHPSHLKAIVELLRSLTQGKLSSRPVQVILTTHSPYLLDQIRLPDDQVLVFRREEGGRRTVSEADREGLQTFMDEFMLGEVWFNRGEEGLLVAR